MKFGPPVIQEVLRGIPLTTPQLRRALGHLLGADPEIVQWIIQRAVLDLGTTQRAIRAAYANGLSLSIGQTGHFHLLQVCFDTPQGLDWGIEEKLAHTLGVGRALAAIEVRLETETLSNGRFRINFDPLTDAVRCCGFESIIDSKSKKMTGAAITSLLMEAVLARPVVHLPFRFLHRTGEPALSMTPEGCKLVNAHGKKGGKVIAFRCDDATITGWRSTDTAGFLQTPSVVFTFAPPFAWPHAYVASSSNYARTLRTAAEKFAACFSKR